MFEVAIVSEQPVARAGLAKRLLLKPELGALLGAVLVFAFFAALSDVFRSASGVAALCAGRRRGSTPARRRYPVLLRVQKP